YSWHLSSSIQNMEDIDPFTDKRPFNKMTEEIVRKLVHKVKYLTNRPFDNDAMMEDGVIIHMDAVLKRIASGCDITIPMLNDIKKLYPYLFSMIVFALNDISEKYDLHIPEEEAAYLVLHFQASIERMEKEQTPKRVLVVCHIGIGMSRLLQAKLEQQ